MTLGHKHKEQETSQPRSREPETKPAPKDTGDVCPVCGRRGRAEGHH